MGGSLLQTPQWAECSQQVLRTPPCLEAANEQAQLFSQWVGQQVNSQSGNRLAE